MLEELSVEYVPQIGFLTTLHERFDDLKPEDFVFAFAQVSVVQGRSLISLQSTVYFFVRSLSSFFEVLRRPQGARQERSLAWVLDDF